MAHDDLFDREYTPGEQLSFRGPTCPQCGRIAMTPHWRNLADVGRRGPNSELTMLECRRCGATSVKES